MTFEPKILSFLCNWCAYAGADLAGISRFQYPPNTRVIRLMCSGRVDPSFIPRALRVGYDGVMILGCHPGDCHYLTGNYQAEKKITLTRKLLDMAGVGRRDCFLIGSRRVKESGSRRWFGNLLRRFAVSAPSLLTRT